MVSFKNRTKLLLHKAIKKDIVKVFSLSSISSLVRMITGFVGIKVIAAILGPSGLALIGQLNNFVTIVLSGATGGINNGVVKYISEIKGDKQQEKSIISTAFYITIWCSMISGLILIIFRKYIGKIILKSNSYDYVFLIFGITVILYSLNMLVISVLNGYKEFKKYVAVNMVGSITGLLFTVVLVYVIGIPGALISIVTYQSVVLLVTLLMVRKYRWFTYEYFTGKFSMEILRKYFSYSIMTLVSAAMVPVSQLIIRSFVMTKVSAVEAGWWEGMNRLSGSYLSIITTSFAVYYLPRLSELKESVDMKREILKSGKFILTLLFVGLVFIYLFKVRIIRLLFSQEFLPMKDMFVWQLIGDFLKISSWLLAYLMIAKSMTKEFIITEVVFSGTFIFLSLLLINLNGVIGVPQAYFINYLLYLITMVFYFKNILTSK